ncbi:MAG: hypothetical protein LAO06_12590 [Acidobacteriia bacterium]|nr:hypothetical protein [Terriglobia bacterium]
MIQLQHSMAGKLAPKDARPSLLVSGDCEELETLTKKREAAFTQYLSARHHLSLYSEPGAGGHTAALETFEAARTILRLSQRDWEIHVTAHHMG